MPRGPAAESLRLTAGPAGRSRHGGHSLPSLVMLCACATAINAMHGPSIRRRWMARVEPAGRPPDYTDVILFSYFGTRSLALGCG